MSAPVTTFVALATLLRLDAKHGRRADQEAADADHFACFDTPSEVVGVDPLEGGLDFKQLISVARTGCDRQLVFFFGAGAVDRIGASGPDSDFRGGFTRHGQ